MSSKPHIQPLLSALYAVLASSRPNDAISEELLEMIGFDDIELVMEVLNERSALNLEVNMPDILSMRFLVVLKHVSASKLSAV